MDHAESSKAANLSSPIPVIYAIGFGNPDVKPSLPLSFFIIALNTQHSQML